MLAVQARGHEVLTVEGLADGDQLHPVQQAFWESHAFQCGFCTPGFVMATVALLAENPTPDEARDPRGAVGQHLPLHAATRASSTACSWPPTGSPRALSPRRDHAARTTSTARTETMATATVNGLRIGFELIGDGDRPWVLTPGGRFTKETPGLRELAEALAVQGNRVLIWDRPNCGESDVCFDGVTESDMQADTLAALLQHLDMTPTVLAGGSAGSRVSLLAARDADVAAALALWWISGGVMGLLTLGNVYCTPSIRAAWKDGMEAVADLPDWAEVIERNPANRQRILDQDRDEFIATMERWMLAYCPQPGQHVPGLPDDVARTIKAPSLVFRSGASDPNHPRATSEAVAELLPNSRLVEPPWGDREWHERQAEREQTGGIFVGWPRLAPQLQEWADEVLG